MNVTHFVATYYENGTDSGFSVQAQERDNSNAIIEYQQISGFETINSLGRVFGALIISNIGIVCLVSINEFEFQYR